MQQTPLPQPPSVTILIAERNKRIRALLEKVFKNLGYQVRAVGNGKEAEAIIRSDNQLSLLVLDPDIPHLSCTLRAIADRDSILPVVMHTLYQDHEGMLSRPFTLTIMKEANPAPLIHAVNSLLRSRTAMEVNRDHS